MSCVAPDPLAEADSRMPGEDAEWDPAEATQAWREATLAALDAWIEEEERMIAEIERWIEAAEAVTRPPASKRLDFGLEALRTNICGAPAAQPAATGPARPASPRDDRP